MRTRKAQLATITNPTNETIHFFICFGDNLRCWCARPLFYEPFSALYTRYAGHRFVFSHDFGLCCVCHSVSTHINFKCKFIQRGNTYRMKRNDWIFCPKSVWVFIVLFLECFCVCLFIECAIRFVLVSGSFRLWLFYCNVKTSMAQTLKRLKTFLVQRIHNNLTLVHIRYQFLTEKWKSFFFFCVGWHGLAENENSVTYMMNLFGKKCAHGIFFWIMNKT